MFLLTIIPSLFSDTIKKYKEANETYKKVVEQLE